MTIDKTLNGQRLRARHRDKVLMEDVTEASRSKVTKKLWRIKNILVIGAFALQ